MQQKRFQRRVENFLCEQCGAHVPGNGYRNHCPRCFTSKHVDVNPGDRLAECGGRMPVVEVQLDHGEQVLVQQCVQCGHRRRNKLQDDDDMTALARLSKSLH